MSSRHETCECEVTFFFNVMIATPARQSCENDYDVHDDADEESSRVSRQAHSKRGAKISTRHERSSEKSDFLMFHAKRSI